jgi:hypothetical protein
VDAHRLITGIENLPTPRPLCGGLIALPDRGHPGATTLELILGRKSTNTGASIQLRGFFAAQL